MKLVIISIISILGIGQAQPIKVVPDNIRAANVIDEFGTNTISSGYMLYGITGPSGEIIGNPYIHDEWEVSSIKINKSDKLFNDVKCKINILTKQVEVTNGSVVRGIDFSKIDQLTFNDRDQRFINAEQFSFNNVKLDGLLEVLVDGETPLLKRTMITIKKPTYNQQLNVGSKNTQLLKNEVFYSAKNGKLIELKKLKKAELWALFPENEAVELFIRENNLQKQNENNLKTIFMFGNKHNK